MRSQAASGLDALVGFDVDEVEDPVSLSGEGLGYSETDSTGFEEGGVKRRAFGQLRGFLIFPYFSFSIFHL